MSLWKNLVVEDKVKFNIVYLINAEDTSVLLVIKFLQKNEINTLSDSIANLLI